MLAPPPLVDRAVCPHASGIERDLADEMRFHIEAWTEPGGSMACLWRRPLDGPAWNSAASSAARTSAGRRSACG